MDAGCSTIVELNNQLMTRMTHAFERMLATGGAHLHWGFFRTPEMTLRDAQNALVDNVASELELGSDTTLLDVGCGVGGTAIYLHQRTKCRVVGISNNQLGIERARLHAREAGVEEHVRFVLADGLANGLADESFDAVVMIEAAYMIPDKELLFRENRRVMRPGGKLVVCDNMVGRTMKLAEMMAHYREIAALKNTFGEGRYETLGSHEELALKAGFSSAVARDLNRWMLPTVDRILAELRTARPELERAFGASTVDDFAMSFSYTRTLCELGISTYAMLVAQK